MNESGDRLTVTSDNEEEEDDFCRYDLRAVRVRLLEYGQARALRKLLARPSMFVTAFGFVADGRREYCQAGQRRSTRQRLRAFEQTILDGKSDVTDKNSLPRNLATSFD